MSTTPPSEHVNGQIPDPIDPGIAELLSCSWSGQILGEDSIRLGEWIAKDPGHVETVSHLARVWERVGQTLVRGSNPDVRDRVLRAIAERPSDRQVIPRLLNQPSPEFLGAPATTPRHADRPMVRRMAQIARVAIPAFAIVAITVFGLRESHTLLDAMRATPPESAQVREYITHRGEHATVQLVDGTAVILGPDSRLSYLDFSKGSMRAVTVQGIAHFTVAHDPTRPFVVYANNAAIQELGTAFSVTAFPEDTSVQVVVFDGRIVLRDQASSRTSGTVLVRSDAAELNALGLVTVRRGVDLDVAEAWTKNRLVFRGATVANVISMLERWYDLKITVRDSTLLTQTLRGEFARQSASSVVAELAQALGVRYEISGQSVVLY